jgi:hypothetical protein
MTSESSSILLKNLGIDPQFFNNLEQRGVYLIKKEKIKKVFSEGAIIKVPSESIISRIKSEDHPLPPGYSDHSDLYNDVEGEYTPFGVDESHLVDRYVETVEKPEDSPVEDNELAIFKNCSRDQISNLNAIMSRMNEASEEKFIVKAYKSKLKSKFYDIYEYNSKILKEKTKYKIFHKCNYPGCARTFASSGWLRSHFQEHLKEIKKNKFNLLFDDFIEQITKLKLLMN